VHGISLGDLMLKENKKKKIGRKLLVIKQNQKWMIFPDARGERFAGHHCLFSILFFLGENSFLFAHWDIEPVDEAMGSCLSDNYRKLELIVWLV
jgi:hypothetical protein